MHRTSPHIWRFHSRLSMPGDTATKGHQGLRSAGTSDTGYEMWNSGLVSASRMSRPPSEVDRTQLGRFQLGLEPLAILKQALVREVPMVTGTAGTEAVCQAGAIMQISRLFRSRRRGRLTWPTYVDSRRAATGGRFVLSIQLAQAWERHCSVAQKSGDKHPSPSQQGLGSRGREATRPDRDRPIGRRSHSTRKSRYRRSDKERGV